MTVGEDAVGLQLAHKLVSAARFFDAAAPEVTDPIAAGGALGRALAGRRVLLVVDDVWSSGQVEPFLIGGEGAVRLFTTRQQGVFPDGAVPVAVDQMADAEAHDLLAADLPTCRAGQARRRAAGRLPVAVRPLPEGDVHADAAPRRRAAVTEQRTTRSNAPQATKRAS